MGQETLILALLKVYGPQTQGNLMRVVYAGQEVFLARQGQYLYRTLRSMEEHGLIVLDQTGKTWRLKE